MKRHRAGFTLIEMLVVLIITALVSGVLFQALERSYSLQRRFGTELFKMQQGLMATDWFRQTVQGIYPAPADTGDVFRGDASSFSGLTVTPLSTDYGAPTPFRWTLVTADGQARTDLVYRDRGEETVILSWQGSDAKFVYFDAEQKPYDRWPPPLGAFSQVPWQIQVEAMDNGERIVVLATSMGPLDPAARMQDIFNAKP